MNASKQDLKELDKKIENHRKETFDNIFENITKPINQLTGDIREMLGEFKSQKEATGRISKEIKEDRERQHIKNADYDKRLAVVESKQNGMLGMGSKLLPYIIIGLIFVSGTLQVLLTAYNKAPN